jgi:alpha-galactosidase
MTTREEYMAHETKKAGMGRGFATVLHAFFILMMSAEPSFASTVESRGDASIAHDTGAGSWTIGAGGASMTILFTRSQDYAVTSILSPSGTNWLRVAGPDTIVTADGTAHAFGSRSDGFRFASVSANDDGRHLQLDVAFTLQPQNLLVTRHIAVVPGSPTFEVWTSFQAMSDSVSVSNINSFHTVVTPGSLHWLTGHQPASGDNTFDTAFARQQQTLEVGQTLTFGSIARSSELTVPWLAIDGANDEFYGGLMWSGGWSLTTTRTASGLSIDLGLNAMTTLAADAPVEGPHAIFGLARGSLLEASAALRSYIIDGIRGGRPLTPLVTYSTWFAYGTRVDESTVRREMTNAAAMGVELFVLDAGWYEGADTHNTSDFEAGLGTWVADAERFPSGLKALTDYAHSLGMKFGVWVEPERVNLSVVGQNGLEESALAKANGSYQSANTALICLAGEAGRQWVVDRLTALIDAVQPDYLKWDNNLWLNCDREGHGHGGSDGNFAHVTALYRILETLRQKYPSLTIENCSAGGNRLDFGMLKNTDVAWMDDHTAPSAHVRHNIDGLSVAFPPAYLLSFLTDLDWEPLHDPPDLPLYVRSRMEAVLGLCFQSAELLDDDRDAIKEQIAVYKNLRPTLASAAAALLTAQPNVYQGPAWDVLQETAADGPILVYAFDSYDGVNTTLVSPMGLQPDVVYRVISFDSGMLGDRTGAELMESGIKIVRSPGTASHVLSLTPQP